MQETRRNARNTPRTPPGKPGPAWRVSTPLGPPRRPCLPPCRPLTVPSGYAPRPIPEDPIRGPASASTRRSEPDGLLEELAVWMQRVEMLPSPGIVEPVERDRARQRVVEDVA